MISNHQSKKDFHGVSAVCLMMYPISFASFKLCPKLIIKSIFLYYTHYQMEMVFFPIYLGQIVHFVCVKNLPELVL